MQPQEYNEVLTTIKGKTYNLNNLNLHILDELNIKDLKNLKNFIIIYNSIMKTVRFFTSIEAIYVELHLISQLYRYIYDQKNFYFHLFSIISLIYAQKFLKENEINNKSYELIKNCITKK